MNPCAKKVATLSSWDHVHITDALLEKGWGDGLCKVIAGYPMCLCTSHYALWAGGCNFFFLFFFFFFFLLVGREEDYVHIW